MKALHDYHEYLTSVKCSKSILGGHTATLSESQARDSNEKFRSVTASGNEEKKIAFWN